MVERAVARDAIEPRAHVDLALVGEDGVEGGGEDLLENVLGVLARGEHVAAEGEQARLVAAAERLEGGGLAFTGNAKMEATVSKMVGGWKGLLLKPADRFFKKDGAGTEVPIHIAGTYKNPEFGIDVKGMKHTHPQRPDEAPASPQASAPATQH